jgi:hypothetical protein
MVVNVFQIVIYKPCKTRVVADALLRLLNSTKPIGVLNQTTNAKFVLYRT